MNRLNDVLLLLVAYRSVDGAPPCVWDTCCFEQGDEGVRNDGPRRPGTEETRTPSTWLHFRRVTSDGTVRPSFGLFLCVTPDHWTPVRLMTLTLPSFLCSGKRSTVPTPPCSMRGAFKGHHGLGIWRTRTVEGRYRVRVTPRTPSTGYVPQPPLVVQPQQLLALWTVEVLLVHLLELPVVLVVEGLRRLDVLVPRPVVRLVVRHPLHDARLPSS